MQILAACMDTETKMVSFFLSAPLPLLLHNYINSPTSLYTCFVSPPLPSFALISSTLPFPQVVHDASLSPDGAVLATASEDGRLKFWQVDWSLEDSEEKPTCLHDFQPHKGAPVSRLIFCDNHLSQDPAAQFWRFLLTAANGNTEVKLWCTVSWKCLQTFT